MMQTLLKEISVRSFLAVVFTMVSTASVWAQSAPDVGLGVTANSLDIAGNAGFSNLTGVDGNKHVNFGGSTGVNLSDRITVLGEYSYLPMGSVSASSGGTSASVNGNYHLLGGAARFYLVRPRRGAPYALVDFGYARCTAGLGVNVSGVGSANASASLNGDYAGVGGGASFYLGHNWGLRPEVRWDRQEYYYSGTSLGQNVVRESVSVFFQWGGHGKRN